MLGQNPSNNILVEFDARTPVQSLPRFEGFPTADSAASFPKQHRLILWPVPSVRDAAFASLETAADICALSAGGESLEEWTASKR
jgi:hypothetical protein